MLSTTLELQLTAGWISSDNTTGLKVTNIRVDRWTDRDDFSQQRPSVPKVLVQENSKEINHLWNRSSLSTRLMLPIVHSQPFHVNIQMPNPGFRLFLRSRLQR